MGTIQEELQTKVLPVFKVPDEWKQGDEAPQDAVPMSFSERLHAAVAAEPGRTSGHYAKRTQAHVPRKSVEALLRQLHQRGYLSREMRPEGLVYFPTDRPYEAGGAYQRKMGALKKAMEARKNKPAVPKTAAKAPSAPQEPPKQAQVPTGTPMDIVRSLSVYAAHDVWKILDNMFGRK